MVQPGGGDRTWENEWNIWNNINYNRMIFQIFVRGFVFEKIGLTMPWLNGSRYKLLFTLPIHVETYILNQKFTPRSWTIKKAKNVLAFEELKTKNTLEIVHEELIEKFN